MHLDRRKFNLSLGSANRQSSIQKLAGILKLCMQSEFVFVCFVALRPKSTAMVIAGRSVQLTTLFPGQA